LIIGVGVDVLDIRRIGRLVQKFPEKFVEKIWTPQELEFCQTRNKYVESLAKMFSLKEAVLKAISDVSGVRWHDVEVLHDARGKPLIGLSGRALQNIMKKSQIFQIEASTSDEPPYVVSFVVIYAGTRGG
jgi:holo-[acyl-carrier protein] synthase